MNNFGWFFIWFLLAISIKGSLSEKPMKDCNTSQVVNQCTKNSTCSQTKDGAPEGLCKCLANFTFNANYTSDADYCLLAVAGTTMSTPTTTTTTPTTTTAKATTTIKPAVTSTAPTKAPTSTTDTTTTTTTKVVGTTTAVPADVSKKLITPVEPHHIASGILVPLFVVFAVLGAVFAVKKYNLIERGQEYMRERTASRNRHNYSDSFDEFDDPLLI